MSSTAGELSGDRVNRTYDRDGLDFYIEPEWCVEALLDAEDFRGGTIYDPAVGSGTIPRVCQRRGLSAFGSDISDRLVDGAWPCVNFLADRVFGDREFSALLVHHVICNPPYGTAQKFVEKALAIASGKVAMLVQSKFLFSQKRWHLFDRDPPARIYFLSTRPSMPPGEKYLRGEVKAKGGKVDYCWIVWPTYHQHAVTTECRWLLKSP